MPLGSRLLVSVADFDTAAKVSGHIMRSLGASLTVDEIFTNGIVSPGKKLEKTPREIAIFSEISEYSVNNLKCGSEREDEKSVAKAERVFRLS